MMPQPIDYQVITDRCECMELPHRSPGGLGVSGRVSMYRYRKDLGGLRGPRETIFERALNTVVALGEDEITKAFNGDSFVSPLYMALGDDTTESVVVGGVTVDTAPDPTLADTGLAQERVNSIANPYARQALTVAIGALANTRNTITYTATWAAGQATGIITELALFSALTGGTMIARLNRAQVAKGANDIIVIPWELTFGTVR